MFSYCCDAFKVRGMKLKPLIDKTGNSKPGYGVLIILFQIAITLENSIRLLL